MKNSNRVTYKQVLLAACGLFCCAFFLTASAAPNDSTKVGVLSGTFNAFPVFLGSGTFHVIPNQTTTIGFTPPTAGVCNPTSSVILTTSVAGIDSGGGGCNDKFINLNFQAIYTPTYFGLKTPFYVIRGTGAVNSNSGCGYPGDYLGFTVAWTAMCP